MKNRNTLLFLLIIPGIAHPAEQQISSAKKEEMTQAEQQDQIAPAIINFTVTTSNAQDARAQNSTSATASQAQVQQAPAPQQQPQVIIVKHEQESVTRNVLLSLFSAGLHLGVGLYTNSKVPAPIPAKPTFIRIPVGNAPSPSPHISRVLQALRNG